MMNGTRRHRTAEELMKMLSTDSEYQETSENRRRAAVAHAARRQADAEPLLIELRQLLPGLSSLDELLVSSSKLGPEVIAALLRGLLHLSENSNKETVVRVLAGVTHAFCGEPLVRCFVEDQTEILRWPIANTIAEARPYGIVDWVISAVRDSKYGTARQMLILALARLAPVEVASPILCALFKDFPQHVSLAMAEMGGSVEIQFLESKLESVSSVARTAVLAAISKLRRRIAISHLKNDECH